MGYAHHNLEGSGGMFPHEYLDFHIPLEQFGYIQSTKFNINTMILCTILLGASLTATDYIHIAS